MQETSIVSESTRRRSPKGMLTFMLGKLSNVRTVIKASPIFTNLSNTRLRRFASNSSTCPSSQRLLLNNKCRLRSSMTLQWITVLWPWLGGRDSTCHRYLMQPLLVSNKTNLYQWQQIQSHKVGVDQQHSFSTVRHHPSQESKGLPSQMLETLKYPHVDLRS